MRRVLIRVTMLAVLGAGLMIGCSPEPAQKVSSRTETGSGWTRPPAIESVRRLSDALLFAGLAEPGARVVLRSGTGAAYAAVANDEGRFEIRVVAPTGDTLLRTETQIGQDAAASPDQLLIIGGGHGPIAVLRAGGASRRLDSAPRLGAVDSDGRLRLASGRTPTPQRPVQVIVDGQAMPVTAGADGRWVLVVGPVSGSGQIRVDGAAFGWPGDGSRREGLGVERAGSGWRVDWSGPAGARQSTWLPDTPTG